MQLRRALPPLMSGLILLLATRAVAPAPARAQAGDVEILSSSYYRDVEGVLHAVGEVVNRTGETVGFVKIVITYRDAAGLVVAIDSGFVMRDSLLPDESSPFDVMTFNTPQPVASYEASVERQPSRTPPLRSFDVITSDARPEIGGGLRITGALRNGAGVEADFILVMAALYDENQIVIRVALTFSERARLLPDEQSPFVVSFPDAPPYSTYKLWVEGSAAE